MNKFYVLVLVGASAWAQFPTLNELPTREFGQLRLQATGASTTSAAPNLVEGRELYGPQGLAFDPSSSPAILYVADTFNNRVLAWRNPAGLSNGAPADKVIGQRDMFSTFGQGPGTALSTGLNRPMALAVDPAGNLYVLDAGNNRILRFPAPFKQTGGDLLSVDLVIGQRTSSSGRDINEGGTPSSKSFAFQPYNGGPLLAAGMGLDSKGNLWVTDPGNNRVLRFPVPNLAANTFEPAADIVLGKGVFDSSVLPPNDPITYPDVRLNTGILNQPSGLAIDASGGLYVIDNYSRVLYWTPPGGSNPPTTGVGAFRVLGIPRRVPQGQAPAPYPNSYSIGNVDTRTNQITPAQGVFTDGTYVYVADTPAHRITRYLQPGAWDGKTDTQPSPQIANWFGQPDLNSGKKNRGQVEASSNGLNSPVAGAFLGTDLWIVDAGNNRVLDFPQTSPLIWDSAVRVVGQTDFGFSSPNLVEGRELWLSAGSGGGAVVVDKTSNPPHLYIADTNNNRVLGFRDVRKVGTDTRTLLTQTADLVIGQVDKLHTTVNIPSGLTDVPGDTGLNTPVGLVVDANGNLWVADNGNGRVLRFPAPFNQPPGGLRATVVLGKGSFTATPLPDAGIANMAAPYGLALFRDGSLAVSDVAHNRVVVFRRPKDGDFVNGQRGDLVLGQQDFSQTSPGTLLGNLKNPTHIAADTSNRLYVCDTGNNRLLVFTNTLQAVNGAPAVFQLGGTGTSINSPLGVAVSEVTGEIWFANTNGNAVYRLPEFTRLQNDSTATVQTVASSGPLAVGLDPFDNLIVAESLNRISFYFPKLTWKHIASYATRELAPGQLAILGGVGKDFDLPDADGTGSSPWPSVLADYKVTVNGTPAPIFKLTKTIVYFQVPMSAPQSGSAEVLVQRDSTGEIVATAQVAMAAHNPGFFTLNQAGTGQVAAVNDDGTVNGPANPIGRGKVISFYLTGAGVVPGAPPDGVAPSAPVPTTGSLKVILQPGPAGFLDSKYVLYSGLGAFAGGWQINIQIPDTVPPGNNNTIALSLDDVSSNVGPNNSRVLVTYAVK